jgi:hypothetical protein
VFTPLFLRFWKLRTRKQPPPITSGATLTAADLKEATSTDAADRLATELCERELKCGRIRNTAGCMAPKRASARAEIASWSCSPAATRARIKECIASIGEESCEAGDLTRRRFICGGNEACPATAPRAPVRRSPY